MSPILQARLLALDASLAAGHISKLDYQLRWMQLGEEHAASIIAATPESQRRRLELQYDDQRAHRPRTSRKYHG